MSELTIRLAQEEDCAGILSFIKGLAAYEKMSDQVVATEEKLKDSLFNKKQAEVLIGEEDGVPVAFALFFHNYSTFLGKANMYLEDLFVKEAHRGRGVGGAMFARLAKLAVQRGCERLDWACLDWNSSAAAFYKKMGAVAMEEWTVHRLQGEALKKLAGQANHEAI